MANGPLDALGLQCPCCGGHVISAETRLWVDYVAGAPSSVSDSDLESALPMDSGGRVCRSCTYFWSASESGLHPSDGIS